MSQIIDSSNHNYRTEMPNIIEILPLTDGEFRFYWYLKRIAGDKGACWKSVEHMAVDLGKEVRTIKRFKKKLSAPFSSLNGRPLIEVYERRIPQKKERTTDLIKIVDIWDINLERQVNENRIRAAEKADSKNVYVVTSAHPGGDTSPPTVVTPAHPKEDPLKEEPSEEEPIVAAASPVGDTTTTDCSNDSLLSGTVASARKKSSCCRKRTEPTGKEEVVVVTPTGDSPTQEFRCPNRTGAKGKKEPAPEAEPPTKETVFQKLREYLTKATVEAHNKDWIYLYVQVNYERLIFRAKRILGFLFKGIECGWLLEEAKTCEKTREAYVMLRETP